MLIEKEGATGPTDSSHGFAAGAKFTYRSGNQEDEERLLAHGEDERGRRARLLHWLSRGALRRTAKSFATVSVSVVLGRPFAFAGQET